jgi:hypothetical protein
MASLPPNGHRLDTRRSSLLPDREAHNEAGGNGTPGTVLDTTTAADSGLLRVAEDDDDGVVMRPERQSVADARRASCSPVRTPRLSTPLRWSR